jgi:hypothetical protein
MRAHKIAQNCVRLDFLTDTTKNGGEFLNHIVGVTCGEIWISCLMLKMKSNRSSGCVRAHARTHTHSPNKLKEFKLTLYACQKAVDNCFLGDEGGPDGGLHTTSE